MPEQTWAPVVFGRTAGADVWWRVRPPGADRQWLENAIHTVIAGGRRLEGRPRFLITVRPGARLVGVACRAIELSRSMHTDGSREMYCFVGWFSAADSGGPELPDLYDHYPAWAGAVYERHMEPVWNAPVSAVRRPDPGRPGPPPWPVAPPPPVDPHLVLPPVIHVNDWDIVWNHALASPAPASVVLGWSTAGRPGAGVTHLGVLDRGVPRLDRSGPLEPLKRVGPVDPHPLEHPERRPPPPVAGTPGPPRKNGSSPILLGGAAVFVLLVVGVAVSSRAPLEASAPEPATRSAVPAAPKRPQTGRRIVNQPLTLKDQAGKRLVPGFETGKGPWVSYRRGTGVSLEFAPKTPILTGTARTLPGCRKADMYPHPAPHVATGLHEVTCMMIGEKGRLIGIRVTEQGERTARMTAYVWRSAQEPDEEMARHGGRF
ncbi:hypothetical protein [Nonomuraea sp. C10]|uniref:hypothetical protein n=1 Tax=Nonomuraea sp. C10 TaxID=2600577 RepID=UPI0011CDD715|nr:hypothetical protein [Nonomuraea sp. C10]TXK35529.1 hypothetical protein FR742_40675 [Nonomuraea sp. C10]